MRWEDLGRIDGTTEQTIGLIRNILFEIHHFSEGKPDAVALPFSEARFGVRLELRMFEPTAVINDVILAALQTLLHHVRTYGGRDVRPRILCGGRRCAEFIVTFLSTEQ